MVSLRQEIVVFAPQWLIHRPYGATRQTFFSDSCVLSTATNSSGALGHVTTGIMGYCRARTDIEQVPAPG